MTKYSKTYLAGNCLFLMMTSFIAGIPEFLHHIQYQYITGRVACFPSVCCHTTWYHYLQGVETCQ